MSEAKVIVITGAANGIGRAVAEAFIGNANDRLILLDRDVEAMYAWIKSSNVEATIETRALDIADLPAVRRVFDEIGRRHSHVHVLVNSAGIADENLPDDVDGWHKVVAVNLHGTFYVTSACVPLMARNGRIINIASILGRAGKVRNTAYCASKHGIVGMTKALALDLAPRQITVNAVLPAWVDTPMLRRELATQAAMAGITDEQIARNARKTIPARRFIESAEVAAMVRYLASPLASGVTAQSLVIDGGVGLGM
jgi:3-hydroxybutyrate dehydrogenase